MVEAAAAESPDAPALLAEVRVRVRVRVRVSLC